MHTSYLCLRFLFFFTDTATTEIYTLSLHDALPISSTSMASRPLVRQVTSCPSIWRKRLTTSSTASSSSTTRRSEEHTSELQSRRDLVCRLLLEKKKKKDTID